MWLRARDGQRQKVNKERTTSILAMAEHPSSPILLAAMFSSVSVLFFCVHKRRPLDTGGKGRDNQRQEVKKNAPRAFWRWRSIPWGRSGSSRCSTPSACCFPVCQKEDIGYRTGVAIHKRRQGAERRHLEALSNPERPLVADVVSVEVQRQERAVFLQKKALWLPEG